ncbi:MAG: hypothetical protein EZS28_026987, partial [Streblomastix strix]
IGQEEQKINGFAVMYIMKKPSITVAKELREELIRGFIKLLIHVKKKALNIKSLSEQELLGKVISVIMENSTLMLTEIHRASAEKKEGGTCQLNTQIIKFKGYKASLTFRPMADLNVFGIKGVVTFILTSIDVDDEDGSDNDDYYDEYEQTEFDDEYGRVIVITSGLYNGIGIETSNGPIL